MTTTFARLMQIITEQNQVDASGVTLETGLADVGLDSLAVAELVFSVEDAFKVNLGDLSPTDIPSTVGGMVALIEAKLAPALGLA